MASPIDVAEYLGLDLIDVDAQQLVEQFLANAAVRFPDWTPVEGNTEVVLAEEIAALLEDDGHTVNSITDNVVEALLGLYGITRYLGAAAVAEVEFIAYDTEGYTIPAGTVVRVNRDEDEVDLETDVEAVIPPGETTVTVTVTAVESGAEWNGPPAGTDLEVLDAITGIDSAVLVTGVGGGADPEDAETFVNRAIPVLSAQVSTLVRPDEFVNYIAGVYPAVTRIKVLDLYDPATPAVRPGGKPGHVTIAMAGPGGSAVGDAAAIITDVSERAHAGLSIHSAVVTVTPVNVDLRVLAYPGRDALTVEAAVREKITAYLNPDLWVWDGAVRVNELIAQADRAEGVDVVLEVAAPAADLYLEGVAALPSAGVITVDVEVP